MAKDISIVLASSSPRRQEMIRGLGLNFRIIKPDVDEIPGPDETPSDFALRAAKDKAEWVAGKIMADKSFTQPALVISGDTIVTLGPRILGKPRDEAHARHMLRELSGRAHDVISGLCVLKVENGAIAHSESMTVSTEVKFKTLSDEEIEAYMATGEVMDKAGAYGIQGACSYMIESIRGSYTNVVGLPLCELAGILMHDYGLHLPLTRA
ncbi:MAG: nucleoside triphosphate pyrophosphatase [Kiritimatiellia bacterium]